MQYQTESLFQCGIIRKTNYNESSRLIYWPVQQLNLKGNRVELKSIMRQMRQRNWKGIRSYLRKVISVTLKFPTWPESALWLAECCTCFQMHVHSFQSQLLFCCLNTQSHASLKFVCNLLPTFSPLHPFPAPDPSPEGFPQTPPVWSACRPHDSLSVAPEQRSLDPPLAAVELGCLSCSGCGEAVGWSCCQQIWMTDAGRCWASGCGMPAHSPPAAVHQTSMVLAVDTVVRHHPHRDFSLARNKTETENHRLLYMDRNISYFLY